MEIKDKLELGQNLKHVVGESAPVIHLEFTQTRDLPFSIVSISSPNDRKVKLDVVNLKAEQTKIPNKHCHIKITTKAIIV